MASQPKENWWRNVSDLTEMMDLTLPSFAKILKEETEEQFKQKMDRFCETLSEHPLAVKHNKSKRAIHEHMKMNLDFYLQGKPLHH